MTDFNTKNYWRSAGTILNFREENDKIILTIEVGKTNHFDYLIEYNIFQLKSLLGRHVSFWFEENLNNFDKIVKIQID